MTLQCKIMRQALFPNYQRFLRAPLVPALRQISPPNANDASKSSPAPTRHSTPPAKMLLLLRPPGPSETSGSSSLSVVSYLPINGVIRLPIRSSLLLSALNDGETEPMGLHSLPLMAPTALPSARATVSKPKVSIAAPLPPVQSPTPTSAPI
jgi:hypothetical protein